MSPVQLIFLFAWLGLALLCLRLPAVGIAAGLILGRTPFPWASDQLVYGALVAIIFSSVGFIARNRPESIKPRDRLFIGVSFLAFGVGIAGSGQFSEIAGAYGFNKGLASLFVTLPLMVLATQMTRDDIRIFIDSFVAIVSAMAVIALFVPTSGESAGRASALGGGPIVFAQLCGLAGLMLLFRGDAFSGVLAQMRSYRIARVLVLSLLLAAALSSGSRGPVISFVVVLFLTLILPRFGLESATNFASRHRRWIFAALFASLATLVGSRLLSDPNSRFALVRNPAEEIERSRGSTWFVGWDLVQSAPPWGHGFGAFADIDAYNSYSHNFVLELASEAGLVGLAVVALVLIRLWRFFRSGCGLATSLLAYSLLVSQSSGDVYNHRYIFVFGVLGSLMVEYHRYEMKGPRSVGRGPKPGSRGRSQYYRTPRPLRCELPN